MHIRPYRPDDEDAVIELMAEQPDFHESPADRAVLRLDHRLQLVAAQDEHVAAYGALLCPPWFDASQLQASVVVTAARRNEGVGSAMWQQILMSTGSAKTVHGSVAVDDKRSLAIARHWGLSVYQTPITTVITLDQRPDSVALADGLWIE